MWKAKGKKKKKKFGLVKGAGVFGAAAAAEPAAEASADAKGGGNTVADVNARLARGGFTSNRAKRQALELQKAALTEDASVFDYDGVYDSMTSARDSAAAAQASERKERKSKYTENLLKQAQMRKLQSDRIYERKLRREAAEVAEMHGGVKDEDKFVGAAYRKQLEEREAWEKAEREEAEREARNDVTKTGMMGFYSNLLTKNIAMGGDVKNAQSSFTVGSKQSKKMTGDESSGSDSGSDSDSDAEGAKAATKPGDEAEALPDYRAAKEGTEERLELERQHLIKKMESEGATALVKKAKPKAEADPEAEARAMAEAEAKAKAKAERLAAAKARALERKRKREEA